MAHPRKLLRQAVVALLVSANTAASARVYDSRVDPLKNRGKLPAISVYALSEDIDQEASANTAPRELTREAAVEVALFVGGVDEVAVVDAIDDLAEQVEAAMDADPYIGGKASDSMLAGTVIEVLEVNGGSDPLVGIAVLTYAVTYYSQPGIGTATDDFLSVKADHRIVGAVEENQASDEFVVQETPP